MCPALENAGHTVVPFDLLSGDNIQNKEQLVRAMKGCEAVVHLAAIPWAMPAKSPEDYWDTNVAGTHNVCSAASWVGLKRVILASSTGYYGFQRGFPFVSHFGQKTYIDDMNVVQRYGVLKAELPDMDVALNRAGVYYMVSKVGAEAALAAYALSGLVHGVVLRLAPVLDEPYEWGLRCSLERAIDTIVWAVEKDVAFPYEVYNIGELELEMLHTWDFEQEG